MLHRIQDFIKVLWPRKKTIVHKNNFGKIEAKAMPTKFEQKEIGHNVKIKTQLPVFRHPKWLKIQRNKNKEKKNTKRVARHFTAKMQFKMKWVSRETNSTYFITLLLFSPSRFLFSLSQSQKKKKHQSTTKMQKKNVRISHKSPTFKVS